MYLIILTDEMRIGAKVNTYQQACLIAELDFQDLATHTMPNEPREWTHFGRLDLAMLIRNHGMEPPSILEYSALIKICQSIAEQVDIDQRSLFVLEQKAGPKPLPGDVRAIESKPQYLPPSIPCIGAPPSIKEASPAAPSGPRAAPTKGATGRVWEIADLAKHEQEDLIPDIKAFRNKVIARCEAEGLNPGTAATQFGKWKKERGL